MSSRRIHPSSDAAAGRRRAARHRAAPAPAAADRRPAVYTVWKRSSMGFHCTDGFCVYDAAGSLAFRVDNYSRRRKQSELLLMDGHGAPLLSLRPQLLSLHDRWNCYTATEEESPCSSSKNPSSSSSSSSPPPQLVFTMHKTSALGSSDEVEVHMATTSAPTRAAASASASSGLGCKHHDHQHQTAAAAGPSLRIEGSFARRSCKIVRGSGKREVVARISRKKAGVASSSTSRPGAAVPTLGDDVFSLVVRPGVDAATIMAVVVVMDRICRKPYVPMVCCAN